ncbi:hypothetical protein [Glycocaulis sp.]|uniref:hypothetical protein n=1 Tax=Glycocaulis sp. TaxID=1969725 RepID=UPI003D22CE6E
MNVKSTIFLRGYIDALFSGSHHESDQRLGLLELFKLSNALVLSDQIYLAGAPTFEDGPASSFFSKEAKRTEGIKLITVHGAETDDALMFVDHNFEIYASSRLKELDRNAEETMRKIHQHLHNNNEIDDLIVYHRQIRDDWNRIFEDVNIKRTSSYIAFAESVGSEFVACHKFDKQAVKDYPRELLRLIHSGAFGDIEGKVLTDLAHKSNSNIDEISLIAPSFLYLAMQSTRDKCPDGILTSLLHLRNSDWARSYREHIAIWNNSSDPRERLAASHGLKALEQAARHNTVEGPGVIETSEFGLNWLKLYLGDISSTFKIGRWMLDRYIEDKKHRSNIYLKFNKFNADKLTDQLRRVMYNFKLTDDDVTAVLAG